MERKPKNNVERLRPEDRNKILEDHISKLPNTGKGKEQKERFLKFLSDNSEKNSNNGITEGINDTIRAVKDEKKDQLLKNNEKIDLKEKTISEVVKNQVAENEKGGIENIKNISLNNLSNKEKTIVGILKDRVDEGEGLDTERATDLLKSLSPETRKEIFGRKDILSQKKVEENIFDNIDDYKNLSVQDKSVLENLKNSVYSGVSLDDEKNQNLINKLSPKVKSRVLQKGKKNNETKEDVKVQAEKMKVFKDQIKEKEKEIEQEVKKFNDKKGLFKFSAFSKEKKRIDELKEEIRSLQEKRMELVLERIDKRKTVHNQEISESRKEKTAYAGISSLEQQEKEISKAESKFESRFILKTMPSWYKKMNPITRTVLTAGIVSTFGGASFATRVGSSLLGMVVGKGAGELTRKGFDKWINGKKESFEEDLKNYKGDPKNLYKILLKNKNSLDKAEKIKLYTSVAVAIVATGSTAMGSRSFISDLEVTQNIDSLAEEKANSMIEFFGDKVKDFKENFNTEDFKEAVPGSPNSGLESAVNNSSSVSVSSSGSESIIYNVQKGDNLWNILEKNEDFWKQNGWQNLSEQARQRVILDIVEDLEKSPELKAEFVDIHKGDNLDLSKLQQYVDNKPNISETVQNAVETTKTTVVENTPADEIMDKKTPNMWGADENTVSQYEKAGNKDGLFGNDAIENSNSEVAISEVDQKNLWKTVDINNSPKINGGMYEIQKGDNMWRLLREEIFKDAMKLDQPEGASLSLDYDELNNLTANTIERIKYLIAADSDFASKIGIHSVTEIYPGQKLNIELIREEILNKKFGSYENMVERARDFHKPNISVAEQNEIKNSQATVKPESQQQATVVSEKQSGVVESSVTEKQAAKPATPYSVEQQESINDLWIKQESHPQETVTTINTETGEIATEPKTTADSVVKGVEHYKGHQIMQIGDKYVAYDSKLVEKNISKNLLTIENAVMNGQKIPARAAVAISDIDPSLPRPTEIQKMKDLTEIQEMGNNAIAKSLRKFEGGSLRDVKNQIQGEIDHIKSMNRK